MTDPSRPDQVMVHVPLEVLDSLLDAAIERALRNASIYHRGGLVLHDAVARVHAGLAASGYIVRPQGPTPAPKAPETAAQARQRAALESWD